ncbi:MAG: hypothetical protein CL844_05615 [Crocinitomicaceae bacterium]|nr:hypothetical protein [Crocinitomicaceae bacterium]
MRDPCFPSLEEEGVPLGRVVGLAPPAALVLQELAPLAHVHRPLAQVYGKGAAESEAQGPELQLQVRNRHGLRPVQLLPHRARAREHARHRVARARAKLARDEAELRDGGDRHLDPVEVLGEAQRHDAADELVGQVERRACARASGRPRRRQLRAWRARRVHLVEARAPVVARLAQREAGQVGPERGDEEALRHGELVQRDAALVRNVGEVLPAEALRVVHHQAARRVEAGAGDARALLKADPGVDGHREGPQEQKVLAEARVVQDGVVVDVVDGDARGPHVRGAAFLAEAHKDEGARADVRPVALRRRQDQVAVRLLRGLLECLEGDRVQGLAGDLVVGELALGQRVHREIGGVN